MTKKKQILSIFNSVSDGNIGLENFARLDSADFEKHVLVVTQSFAEAKEFLDRVYPDSELTIHARKSKKPFLTVWKYLLSRVRQIKPDLIHVHHGKAAFAGAIASLFGRCKLVTTAHNIFQHYKTGQKSLFLPAYFLSNVVVCNSMSTLESLPFIARHSKRKVVYNGVDFSRIDNQQHSPDPSKTLRIGTICRLVPQKDLETFIRGYHHFTKLPDAPKSELVFVGEGPLRQSLEQLVSELGLEDQVAFRGQVGREEAYRELHAMDIFVVSSQWEGFCNSLVEAAGAAKPLIVTDINTLNEVIGPENALFFPFQDWRMLSEHLATLASDENKRQEMGSRAAQYVRSKYSLPGSAKNYENVYRSLLKLPASSLENTN